MQDSTFLFSRQFVWKFKLEEKKEKKKKKKKKQFLLNLQNKRQNGNLCSVINFRLFEDTDTDFVGGHGMHKGNLYQW